MINSLLLANLITSIPYPFMFSKHVVDKIQFDII